MFSFIIELLCAFFISCIIGIFITYFLVKILNKYSIGPFYLKTHCRINGQPICRIKKFNNKQLTIEQYNHFNFECQVYNRIEMPCRKCRNHFKFIKENAIFI